ncbi:phosphatase PAP2 family protein [Pontibacter diazotrophicus]|uniref:Phosphatase PAP2 family protein n=1 Tax=Pontibacter diazotrophicus TaxID=1400979 RepID=A0A3D8LGI6_9BACT|nr:phosphatase PAP2 family protein [Pontibacter diazotrophicus]RDV16551.1 phosphatase PAP2 family protein [Pontibacter diazotrophicus]
MNEVVLLLTLFIVLIGFSRIYLRVHYASDALAGFSAGFLWVVINIWVLPRVERFTRETITTVLADDPAE